VSGASLGTWWRTVTQLHPLQLTARVPHRLVQLLVRASGISVARPPRLRSIDLAASVAEGLACFARDEAERYAARLPWLAKNANLAAYEARYALDLGPDRVASNAWTDATSAAPYVASVRARRLASAVARGRHELVPHLVRAARAVCVAPELHLLGNHLLENGIGLVAASSIADGPEATVWWTLGAAILDWQLPHQFYPDGMHDEGSMTYHLALVAGLIEATVLARAGGRPVPSRWGEFIERGIAIARAYEAPDGRYPLFNDAAYDAGPSIAQVVALARACGFPVREPPRDAVLTSHVGWVVLRNARDWCVVKAGPDGSRTQPGHVHADLLSIELWVDGAKLISDPGVTSYNDDAERAWCRSSAAHNGPHLDGEDSSEVWGAFRTGRRATATASVVVHEAPTVTGTRATTSGAVLQRTVSLTDASLTIDDLATGTLRPLRVRFSSAVSESETSPHARRHVVLFGSSS
jgi:hypothetical protein